MATKRWSVTSRLVQLLVATSILGSSLLPSEGLATAARETYGTCAVPERSVEERDDLISDALKLSIPASGALSSSSSRPAQPGASYSAVVVESTDVAEGERLLALTLDDVDWISSGVFLAFDETTPDLLPIEQIAAITLMLRNWSTCSLNPTDDSLLNFLSDFGVGWIYSRGDPFLTRQSPAVGIVAQSTARTAGSLPLLLVEVRRLSDERVAVVIGEGSSITGEGQVTTPRIPSSLWILDRTPDGWKIDAIFGGFTSAVSQFIVI